jgi:hypothetical protein
MSQKSTFVGTVLVLWNEERGAIVSSELVLILTIAVLSMVVGLGAVSVSVSQELEDLAEAFGAVDQSYMFNGARVCTAVASGSSFNDKPDSCDCEAMEVCNQVDAGREKCE